MSGAAGHTRNSATLTARLPTLVVAFRSNPASRGTDNMIGQALAAGVQTIVIDR